MKTTSIKAALLCCAVSFITFSCDKEDTLNELEASSSREVSTEAESRQVVLTEKAAALTSESGESTSDAVTQQWLEVLAGRAVSPTECAPTALNAAIRPYVLQFGEHEWEWYSYLALLNQLYAGYLDNSSQHFGAAGELTDFAAKHKRNLESFWSMANQVALIGQHNSTLLNRDAIAQIYMAFVGAPSATAYKWADEDIELGMKPSQVFQTTPLLSLDGFATTGKRIVIGDGIIKVLNDAGTDSKVAFAGVLAHEWGHQVQFKNFKSWFGVEFNKYPYTAEGTRLMELEADVLTGYYLTHKRGATYNWKDAAQFLQLFYNIGDCSFTSEGHHGTPNQRMAAARLGWVIAKVTYPVGHILTADEVHALFNAAFNDILANTIESTDVYASLKSADLKNMYTKILGYEEELTAIASGALDQSSIENL
ncbi:hypothetical protein H8S95_11575 [Pontibacter sp. KCTC 32443]|uniref:hypothetical protein n=1 Tax=Pontibacter TaxID=323449 RepID=UPI00164E739A|nr:MULTISPECIES: hypothetical protein [Pontibacter]MBC5774704.1 hypothetical protein [Pontibacter sp. KCTC 32443]